MNRAPRDARGRTVGSVLAAMQERLDQAHAAVDADPELSAGQRLQVNQTIREILLHGRPAPGTDPALVAAARLSLAHVDGALF